MAKKTKTTSVYEHFKGHLSLLDEWDDEKNGGSPHEVIFYNKKKYYWLCPHGHSYLQSRGDRVRSHGNNCPVCNNRIIVKGFNDFETVCKKEGIENPLEYWDDEKNTVDPRTLGLSGKEKYWWKCKEGHSWQARLFDMYRSLLRDTESKGCPYCSNQNLLVGFNDFETKCKQAGFGEILEMFDYDKNDILPSQIIGFSAKQIIYWKCKEGHSWQAVPNAIFDSFKNGSKSKGCPYCSNQKVLTGYNDLATIRPDLLNEYDYKKNTLNPKEIGAGDKRKVWWVCSKCGNEWQANVVARTYGMHDCPECALDKSKKTRYEKLLKEKSSLAEKYPKIASEWDNEKNGDVKPSDVKPNSSFHAWWKCPDCGFSWQTSPANRTRRNSGCPACNRGTLHPGHNDLATTHPDIAKMWHPTKNGSLTPRDVKMSYNLPIWWKCPVCGHEWKTGIYNLTRNDDKRSSCPECSRKSYRAVTNENDIKFYCKSKGVEWVLDEWDHLHNSLLGLFPDKLCIETGRKVWWICSECGERYLMLPTFRINEFALRGRTACPRCKGQGIKKAHFI